MSNPESSFIATARKYRPQKFADILAQPGVTVTLKNALALDRVHHAYLFCGPRGTGKTTTARVLAKALNCTERVEGEPCGQCPACRMFQEGKSLDVIEIDGASNRGVEDIRNLRERVAYASAGGGWKVYIVDEVHMLTNEAFNALLKTLEEPPPKVAFMFATTEPGKVPATILSRCQRFDFRRISPAEVRAALEHVTKIEEMDVDAGALELLAHRAGGSLRDAFSLMDQTAAFARGKIDRAVVEQALGVVSEESLFRMTELWTTRDTAGAFAHLLELWEGGIDPGEWAQAFGEHLRALLAARVGGVASPGPRYDEAVAGFALGDLLRAQVMLSDLKLRLRLLTDPRPEVELFVLRIFTLADTVSLAEMVRGKAPQGALRPPAGGAQPQAEPKLDLAAHAAPPPVTGELTVVTGTFGQPAEPMLDLKLGPAGDTELPTEPWERFLVLLRRKAPWAASELRRGRLDGHDEKAACFFVPDTNPFNQERLGNAGIQIAIREAFRAAYGLDPKVEFRFGAQKSASADTQSLLAENADLAGLIAATDGEIVARRPRA